jgi:hypothetical protein
MRKDGLFQIDQCAETKQPSTQLLEDSIPQNKFDLTRTKTQMPSKRSANEDSLCHLPGVAREPIAVRLEFVGFL